MARILVLEDDVRLAEAMTELLEAEGHEVERTPSGEQAVLRAGRDGIELVLADLQVEDLSGLGAMQGVLDVTDVPVILLSGRAGAWEEDALRLGAVAAVRKPVDADNLVQLVRTQLAAGTHHGDLHGDVRELEDEDLQRIARLPEEELDRLPFGLLRVDEEGIVTACNAFEAAAGGVDPVVVVGHPLQDLAPCLQVKRFLDAWREVRAQPRESRVLRFHFPHHGASCLVSVRLFYDEEVEQLWLFISKRPDRPDQAARAPV